MIPIGTKVKITLPSLLPNWVFDSWKTDLLLNDQESFITKDVGWSYFSKLSGSSIDIIYLSPIKSATNNVALGVPVEWLKIIDSSSLHQKVSCNCSLTTILAKGCQNRNHQ